MPETARQIFRRESLDSHATPERLDTVLRVVRPQSWLVIGGVGIGLALALLWALLGRVPATARGAAILVRPQQVVAFESLAAGRIDAIAVQPGQHVDAGDVLVTLQLPAVTEELAQMRARRALVRSQHAAITRAETELCAREKAFLGGQRDLIRGRIDRIRGAAEQVREQRAHHVGEQRAKLTAAMDRSDRICRLLQDRLEARRNLVAEHAESQASLVEPQIALFGAQLRRAELDVQAAALDLQVTDAQEYYDERLDRIRDLEQQLHDLQLREMVVDRRQLEQELSHAREIEAIEQSIGQLEVRLATDARICSGYSGRVLEIVAAPGQRVAAGHRLGRIEIDDPAQEMAALAFFAIKDGKKVRPGDRIRVSPATVERERFGGIVGVVESVSELPVTTDAAAREIGDADLAHRLLGNEARILVSIALEPDAGAATGYRWTSGTGPEDVTVTPGTTAEARVTLEERTPITLVLPFLKSLF